VTAIQIPSALRDAVVDDGLPERSAWLAGLPATIERVAADWALELGAPYLPGGQCAWVAPVRDHAGDARVLKVAWRHPEAEDEADGLRFWDGDGAVRCYASRRYGASDALLLERCAPGAPLGGSLPEPEQDVVIAGLLRRLWDRPLAAGHPFRALEEICERWAAELEANFAADARGLDPGLARAGVAALRDLPRSTDRRALLCTDLHAGNVLAARREPWLAIDPKPFVGDPAFDTVQHMLNCDARLATDPAGLATRMADLLDVDPDRVRQWLFARCAQEALHDHTMREPARRLAL
jgi:streptomycin 6-kinase